MKILQLAKLPPSTRGGIEKLVNQLSTLLSSSNVRCDILCFDQNRKSRFDVFYTHTVYKARSLFTFKSTPFSLHNLYFLRKLAKSYDLIHVHLPNPLSALYALSLSTNIKITVHFHAEARNLQFYRLYRFIEKRVLDRALMIICTSPFLAQSPTLISYSKKIKIVPLGLSPQDYNQSSRDIIADSYKFLDKELYFIFLGRFSKYKNIPFLIEAFSAFRASNSQVVKLILAGSGSQHDAIVSYARSCDFESDIIIVDNPDDHLKRYLLKNAIASVLPSTTMGEAFGFVQLESMAMATPVISFKIPFSGVSYVNENMVSGLSLPTPASQADAIKSLCVAMTRLFVDTDLRNELGSGAEARSQNFRVVDTVEMLRNAFMKISG